MVNIFRRFQQPLLVALTIVIIISFVVLYNLPNRSGNFSTNEVARIYGRTVTQGEAQRTGRRFEVCRDLQLQEMLRSLYGQPQSLAEAQENFLWNSIILRHEADQLGVVPSESEVETAIRALPAFQTNGAFDSSKYTMFLQMALAPRGFTPRELEEVVADDLRLKRIKQILGATVSATPSEVKEEYTRQFQKRQVSVVRINAEDFKKAAQVSEEDIKKLYEGKKESLKTQEKRKVKFVAFTPPKTEKPLEGQEKAAALEKLADQAHNFSVELAKPGAKFDDVAAAQKLTVKESPAFALNTPPAELDSSDEVAQAAFALTPEKPTSDALSGANGYFVIHLAGTEPARPLGYEEAKAELTEQLKTERAQEAQQLKSREILTKIQAELKAGKSFADAATAAGVKAEQLPPFSPRAFLPQSPDSFAIMQAGSELKEGALSEFVPTGTGAVLIHADKLLPVEEKDLTEQQGKLADAIERAKSEGLFLEWLRTRAQAANLQVPKA